MRVPVRVRYALTVGATAVLLAACGSSGDTATSSANAAAPASQMSASMSAAMSSAMSSAMESAAPSSEAMTSEAMTSEAMTSGEMSSEASSSEAGEKQESLAIGDTSLGKVLIDGDGMTMYLFTKDSPNKSTCAGDCLTAWPPLPGPVTAGDGIDASLLGTTKATDGSTQATYNGWPLYYFAKDTKPGDVNGQGVNKVWWVLDAKGEAIGK